MKKPIVFAALALTLSGCATLTRPREQTLSALPIIEFGQPTPVSGGFILHFASGQLIPTNVSVNGNLFERPVQETVNVALARDVYLYKDWASLDKIHWSKAKDLIPGHLSIVLPGYMHPAPGHIAITMNVKGANGAR